MRSKGKIVKKQLIEKGIGVNRDIDENFDVKNSFGSIGVPSKHDNSKEFDKAKL